MGAKRTLKRGLLTSAYRFGVFDLQRSLQKKRVAVLMYHRFSATPEPFKVTGDVFVRQLEFFRKRYSVIPFHQYLDFLYGETQSLPLNPLLITIDDGYVDNYDIAFPVLKQHGMSATIFLTTDFVSRNRWLWANRLEYILKNAISKNFVFSLGKQQHSFGVDTFDGWHATQLTIFNYCRTLPNQKKNTLLDQLARQVGVTVPLEVTPAFASLEWDQIREMHMAGIEFGSHSCTHPICSRLSDAELREELLVSRREIEQQLGVGVDVFCFPNGQPEDYNDDVIRQVRQAGYRAAVTTVTGFNHKNNTDPYRIKRLSLGTDDPAVLLRELTRKSEGS